MKLTKKIIEDALSEWGTGVQIKILTTEGDAVKALVFCESGRHYRISVNPEVVMESTEELCSLAMYSNEIGKFFVTPWEYKDTEEEAMLTLISMLAKVES